MNDQNAVTQVKDEQATTFSRPLKYGLFLGIAGVSAFIGFATMVSREKRRNAGKLYKKPEFVHNPTEMEVGRALAAKALRRATIYAVGGFSLFCLLTWKIVGARDFEEFAERMGNIFPRIKRNKEPEEVDWHEILKSADEK